ncbi:pantoate--beta-alanine ligase [Candidatus Peregrinibacteria bacterium]|nr:pantoate--beta-alanine ligase [Candidatus Peregrinibacteria bacterium]
MRVIDTVDEMKKNARLFLRHGKTIGFVPTMGFLHEGHMSLVRAARKENDIVVVSIFVNPTQFGPNEDYSKYPRDFERDKSLLEKEKVDILFHPSVEEMYDSSEYWEFLKESQREKRLILNDFMQLEKIQYAKIMPLQKIKVEVPKELANILCGKYRPAHFQGVAKVVTKLFHIIQPDCAYFGQKDFQQAIIVDRLINDLNFSIKLRIMPTVRESDGLAMSSRNIFLTKKQRKDAAILYKALIFAKNLFDNGERNSRIIERKVKNLISQNRDVQLQYTEIRDFLALKRIENIEKNAIIVLAANVGKTRLIDNIYLTEYK